MARDDLPSPHSTGKHRLSTESDSPGDRSLEEEESKRRKHHHHRHRRHHRSRQGRDGDDGMDADDPSAERESAPPVNPLDDEREEGEILDDDEGGGGFSGGRIGASEAESGEIRPEGADVYPDPMVPGEEDALSDEWKVLKTAQIDEKMMDASPVYKSNLKDEVCHPGDGDNKSNPGRDLRHVKPANGRADSKKHRHVDKKISKTRTRPRSPDAKDSSATIRDVKMNDSISRASHINLERPDLGSCLDPDDVDRRKLDKNNNSLSPESLSDVYRTSQSSFGKHNDMLPHDRRRRSVERRLESSTDDDQANKFNSRDIGKDDVDMHDRADLNSYRGRANDNGILWEGESNDRYSRHDDRHGTRERDQERERSKNVREMDYMLVDREVDMGPENRHSRHHKQLDKHQSRNRETEKPVDKHQSRDRERNRESLDRHQSRDHERGRDLDRHQSRDRDREKDSDRHRSRDRERERELDSQQYRNREPDRRHSQDRERYSRSSKDSYRDRPRDTNKERSMERERVNNERERDKDVTDRDKRRERDRELSVYKVREQDRQTEKSRVSSRDRHQESRHLKDNEVEHDKYRMRSKELLRGRSSAKDVSEARKTFIREEEEHYQDRIEHQLLNQDEEDADKIKEESRKRRQAILEKYRQQQLQQVDSSSDVTNKGSDENLLTNENEQAVTMNAENQVSSGALQTTNVNGPEVSNSVENTPMRNEEESRVETAGFAELGQGSPKSERSEDMFTDDIFGESPAGDRKMGKSDGPRIDRSCPHDNWDDAEGYYSYRLGEVLDGRYEIIAAHGKGVFSTVVRSKDLKAMKGDPKEVAIKIIRNNETMYKAGQDELVILKKLVGADPEDKRHCVRFLSSFKYRSHLCLVFESLHMNLREVLKKFGRNIGLNLIGVRSYAKQLFYALKHLKNCGVLHCDIKPDNMLVNEGKNVLKLCDFGNAMFAGKNEITPYLVSRFYRAPEIILGLPYDHPMDMWSVGCCLYELYTGKVLFPGPSNNDMLRLQMELKGPFPKKMLRKGAFVDHHFDQDINFLATEEDPVTKKMVKRLIINIKPKDIGSLITGSSGEDPKMLSNFKDLLERIFVLDPEKRLTVSQALSHPFITGFCQGFEAINNLINAKATKEDWRLLDESILP